MSGAGDGGTERTQSDRGGPTGEGRVRPAVYLAGPDVFHSEAMGLGARKKAICAAHGLEGLYPLDNELGGAAGDRAALAGTIYAANIAMIERADAVIANVTPFLGACADDGTAFEIGFAVARRLPVALYDNGAGDTVAKAKAYHGAAAALRGAAFEAEDFGLPVNLMLAIPALQAGLIASGEEALHFEDLTRFEQAAALLAASLDAEAR